LGLSMPFGKLIKPKEKTSTVDGMNLIIAGIIIHNVFPFNIALTAMLMGIIGDAASSVGSLLGEYPVFNSSDIKTTWEGVFLTFIINMIIGLSVLGLSVAVVPMAISAIIIESLVVKIDDNLVVPIAVALIGLITLYVFP